MQPQETEVVRLIANYGKDIRLILQLLEERFMVSNAIQQWRSKSLDRVGFLDVQRTIHYAMHGAGCTVEFQDGKHVSFDLSETGNYTFDAWKFKCYTESIGTDYDLLDDQYIKSLAKNAFHHQK